MVNLVQNWIIYTMKRKTRKESLNITMTYQLTRLNGINILVTLSLRIQLRMILWNNLIFVYLTHKNLPHIFKGLSPSLKSTSGLWIRSIVYHLIFLRCLSHPWKLTERLWIDLIPPISHIKIYKLIFIGSYGWDLYPFISP